MTLPLSNEIDKVKYRQTGEDFYSKIGFKIDGQKATKG